MKTFLVIVIAVFLYFIFFSDGDRERVGGGIYFGKYCLDDDDTWNLALKGKLFIFESNDGDRYTFRYKACDVSDGSVTICSSEDKLAKLTFSDFKEVECDEEQKECFSKVSLEIGNRTSLSGVICCNN